MGYVTWRIDYIPFASGTWSEVNRVTLGTFYDPLVRLSLGTSKDTFDFSLDNFNGNYNQAFGTNTKVFIYRVANSATVNTATDLLMTGTVNEPSGDVTGSSNKTKVSGYSFSEYVLSALTFVDATNMPVPQALEEGLLAIARQNSNFQIVWDSSNIPLRSDGSAFPVAGEKYFNKPYLQLIEKVSTAQFTGDGSYFYYITPQNTLRWFSGSGTTTREVDLRTFSVAKYKYGIDKSKIINFVVCKGGILPDGSPVSTYKVDQASYGKNGQKPYFLVSKTNNARELTRADFIKSWGNTAQATNYPDLTSAFTTSWTASFDAILSGGYGSVTFVKGSPVIINTGSESNNKKAYNEAVKAEVIYRLKQEAEFLIFITGAGLLKLDLHFKPFDGINWGLGDQVNVTLPEVAGTSPITLRVVDIQYSTTEDVYSLEQDRGTL